MHFLYRAGGIKAQNRLWTYIANDLVRLNLDSDWRRIQQLMEEYADLPLDLADASLICAAEQLDERKLFTLDQSLRAVRIQDNQYFEVVP
jgi:uncharacterized protein